MFCTFSGICAFKNNFYIFLIFFIRTSKSFLSSQEKLLFWIYIYFTYSNTLISILTKEMVIFLSYEYTMSSYSIVQNLLTWFAITCTIHMEVISCGIWMWIKSLSYRTMSFSLAQSLERSFSGAVSLQHKLCVCV